MISDFGLCAHALTRLFFFFYRLTRLSLSLFLPLPVCLAVLLKAMHSPGGPRESTRATPPSPHRVHDSVGSDLRGPGCCVGRGPEERTHTLSRSLPLSVLA